jgi:hypothetical protein
VASQQERAELASLIESLAPETVDPEEAMRAANAALDHARQLAAEYQVEDPPLIHNVKVNMGDQGARPVL